MPITLTTMFFMVGIILAGMLHEPKNIELITYGVAWISIPLIYDFLIAKSTIFHGTFSWSYAITSILGSEWLSYILPLHLNEIFYLMIIFSVISVATISGRYQAYLTLMGILAISLPNQTQLLVNIENALDYFVPFVISIVALEAILRIKDTTQQHIHRLETINRVSHQIMLSLNTEQTISLLTAAIQDALEADTYFIGIVKDNEIHLNYFMMMENISMEHGSRSMERFLDG